MHTRLARIIFCGAASTDCNRHLRRRGAGLFAHVRGAILILILPLLAAPAHAQVTMTVDAAQNVQPISPWIYGVNVPQTPTQYGVVPALGDVDASWNVTARRMGGERWQTYNWNGNYSDCGGSCSTGYQQNDSYLSSSTATGAAVAPAINDALNHSAATLLTVPIQPYVSADTKTNQDVR